MVGIGVLREEVAHGAGEPVAFVGAGGAAPGVLHGDVEGGPEGEVVPYAGFEGGLELGGGGGEGDAAGGERSR